MITIFDLQKYLEQQLNGLGNEELFKVYYWAKNYDKNYLESGQGFYVKDQDEPMVFDDNKEFILSRIVDYNGDYEPIPNVTISNQSFSLDFYFPTEKTEDMKYILNKLILNLKGKVARLNTIDNDPLTGSTAIFKTEVPTYVDASIQHLRDLSGFDDRFEFESTKEYTIAEIRIFVTITEKVLVGNDISYKIYDGPDKTTAKVLDTILPLTCDLVNSVEVDSEQELGKDTTDCVPQTNESMIEMSFNLKANEFGVGLYLRSFLGGGQDTVVYLTPLFYGEESILPFPYIMTNVHVTGGLGQPMVAEVTFRKADVDEVQTTNISPATVFKTKE